MRTSVVLAMATVHRRRRRFAGQCPDKGLEDGITIIRSK